MPAASLLLPLLARLLHLIPSVLRLLPVRPPPAPSHSSLLSPHSFRPPPFVPRLPPFALRRPPFAVGRFPFVVSPSTSSGQALSNHERPLHHPAYPNLLALPPSSGARRYSGFGRQPASIAAQRTRHLANPPPKNPPNLAPAGPAPPTGGAGPAGASTPKTRTATTAAYPCHAGGNRHPVLPRPAPARSKKTTRCAPRVNPASAESLP